MGPRLQEDLLGEEIANCLFEKGFCVVRTCQEPEDVQRAFAVVQGLAREGKLQRFPEEVEGCHLGFGCRGLACWLDRDKKVVPQDATIRANDRFFSTLFAILKPYCGDFGKVVEERTPGLVSISLPEEEESQWPAPEANDEMLGNFFTSWRRSQLKMVHFMGPGTCSVVLHARNPEGTVDGAKLSALPVKQEQVELSVPANTILIFRTHLFTYSCKPQEASLMMSASLLEHANALVFNCMAPEGAEEPPLPDYTGPKGPQGEQVNVINLATRLMACWDEPLAYRAGLCGGCDTGVEIPFTRWNVHDYFNPDSATLQAWQCSTMHQSVVEGIELFDHKHFEISANEVRVMDPMQRHVLEVSAQCLWRQGITKKHANRNPMHAGVSVGLDKDDWDFVPNREQGGNNVQAIIANRVSFIFNLRGPNYVADTACSASLTATHLAKFGLRDREVDKLDFHIAIGIHQCLAPHPFIGCSQTHMSSPIGRCLTFNASASGYMRGDGCSGMTLKWGDLPDDREAVWRASQVGQNGRSATLTAPNGLAQEEVIWKAIREARTSPPESCVWNCHGTGTSLGDPIEVGGVRKVNVKEPRSSTLIIVTNKTHTGHLEGGAAMTSLIAACFQVKSGCAAPIVHFRQLNPHLEQSNFDAVFSNEFNCYNSTQANVHVSSFGFGGTNGHVIFWGQSKRRAPSATQVFSGKLRQSGPPEVRVTGHDPYEWEWDGPEKEVKPGDKYSLEIRVGDPSSQRWIKEETGGEDDDLDDFFCISGNFNQGGLERMEDGPVLGLRTITVTVPASGVLEFRFFLNGNVNEAIVPDMDRCKQKLTPIVGPFKESHFKANNFWLVESSPGQLMKIDLFVCRGRRALLWRPV